MLLAEANFTETITPYLPLIGTVAGGIVIGLFALWNRRRGAVETKAPDVNAIWAREERGQRRLDEERAHRRRLEDFAERVLDMFHAYVRRVRMGGSPELTPEELDVHNATIPTLPKDD